MQRVDDVTGETIRLTAHQKELRVESMIARINELTRQVNHVTHEQMLIKQSLGAAHQELVSAFADFRAMRLWARTRWLLLGR
jgi:hypothetical protein